RSLTEQEHGRDTPPNGRLEELTPVRLKSKARVHEHSLPLEKPRLGPAQALGIRPFRPFGSVDARLEGGGRFVSRTELGQLLAYDIGADHREAGPLGEAARQRRLSRPGQTTHQGQARAPAGSFELPQGLQPVRPGSLKRRSPLGSRNL